MDPKDSINLSLDDIIKKKKVPMNKSVMTKKRGPVAGLPPRMPNKNNHMVKRLGTLIPLKKPTPVGPIFDARNKIIQRTRSKVRDARDMLIQKTRGQDARIKLMSKHKRGFQPPMMPVGEDLGRQPTRHAPPPRLRPVPKFPPGRPARHFVDYDDMDVDMPPSFPLRRTVQNDISLPAHHSIPPFPHFGRPSPFYPFEPKISSDPFDCYEVPIRRPVDVSEPVHIQRKIYNIESDQMPRKGILRTARMMSPTIQRRYVPDENSSLSYEMRSRLERAPDPNEPAGIFSRNQVQDPPAVTNGYRIVVSNLHSSVTQGDIKELFEDIGDLLEARLVRPGVAEVIFKTLRDAEEAVDTYHNRHLDGQPMKCLLVNPRASSKPTAPALKMPPTASQAVVSNRQPTSLDKKPPIDIDVVHSVLFRRN